jgi:hypothetical protein
MLLKKIGIELLKAVAIKNASKFPSQTTVPMGYMFPLCLPPCHFFSTSPNIPFQ